MMISIKTIKGVKMPEEIEVNTLIFKNAIVAVRHNFTIVRPGLNVAFYMHRIKY